MCYTVDMKFRLNDRQKGWVATILITVILSFLLYAAFFRGAEIVRSLRYLTRQMMSLVCGVAIAYILSPVLSFIERKITIPLCSRAGVDVNSPSSGKKRRRVRMFSVVLTILFFLLVLYGLIRTVLPQVSTGPEGIVVVSVTIDPGGNVSGAKIGSGTTIKDEEILDKCKEAALKSKFNINVYVGSKHPGTITYTFTAK